MAPPKELTVVLQNLCCSLHMPSPDYNIQTQELSLWDRDTYTDTHTTHTHTAQHDIFHDTHTTRPHTAGYDPCYFFPNSGDNTMQLYNCDNGVGRGTCWGWVQRSSSISSPALLPATHFDITMEDPMFLALELRNALRPMLL